MLFRKPASKTIGQLRAQIEAAKVQCGQTINRLETRIADAESKIAESRHRLDRADYEFRKIRGAVA